MRFDVTTLIAVDAASAEDAEAQVKKLLIVGNEALYAVDAAGEESIIHRIVSGIKAKAVREAEVKFIEADLIETE